VPLNGASEGRDIKLAQAAQNFSHVDQVATQTDGSTVMSTRKTSLFRTFIEYLGRGAVPADGIYWVDTASPARQAKPGSADARRFNDAASPLARSQPHGKYVPAARGM
jgi:hypothetical protein